MTVGQRIAQKRKKLGLSQEALGEQLGVSRQSIYKWEANAALPDIDKLIALSRLFGVTVGWLLGVEEDAPAPEASGELSETQLKMVEEIVGRYLAVQPKPDAQHGKRFFRRGALVFVVLFIACFLAIFNLFSRLDRMDLQYGSLQNSIQSIDRNVQSQINGISNRVEEILKSQNDLTADYGAEIKRADLEHGSITFSMYAVPKTYVEGMSAKFSVDNGNGSNIREIPNAILQKFSADITCELTDTITLSVIFIYPDGTSQTQLLTSFYDLYNNSLPSYPDIMVYEDLFLPVAGDGTVTIPELYLSVGSGISTAAVNSAVGQAEAAEIRAGLFKNQTLVAWAEPCAQPDSIRGERSDQLYFRFPETTLRMTGADDLCFAVVVTDEYGRDGVYMDIPYILEDGELTWPNGADLSGHNPTGWTY